MTETVRRPTAIRRELGQRLRGLRPDKDMTVAQAATRAGTPTAVAAGLAHLDAWVILGVMAAAWPFLAFVELLVSRHPAQPRAANARKDDWAWTLRSAANRPLLRWLEDGPLVVVTDGPNARPKLKARLIASGQTGTFGESGQRITAAVENTPSGSRELLARVVAQVRERGWRTANLDCTVIAERPRLAPHLPAMRERLSQLLGVALEGVSVKATTTEGMGFTGRQEGIAAQAVVLLERAGPQA